MILIAFAIVVGRLVSNRIEADFRADVHGTAVGLAVALANGSGASGVTRDDLKQIAMANHAEIRIVDQAGNDELRDPRRLRSRAPRYAAGIRQAGSLRVASELIGQNNLGGALYVQYAQSRANVDATIDRLWLFLGGGVLVGTLLAVFAGMTVANRAMQPIAALTGTARRIAGTRDPSMRIPQPESDDEVAELARTLDEMLRELDAATDRDREHGPAPARVRRRRLARAAHAADQHPRQPRAARELADRRRRGRAGRRPLGPA